MSTETGAFSLTLPDVTQLRDWRYTVDVEGIAWALFDREGESANALGRRPLEELAAIVEETERAAKTGKVKGLVLMSGKDKSFIVGADIREFDQINTEAKVIGAILPVNAMLDRIERMPIPVVAAVHGVCVGGGFELILACHYRIATRDDATRVGFPEVKLGLFPGFNGTARSIRQAGPVAAMQNMLTGSMIRASVARRLGYIDQLVDSPLSLHWAARKAVLQKRKAKPAGLAKSVLALRPMRDMLVKRMRKETERKVRQDHYPAPFRLIDLFEQHGGNLAKMKEAETRAFAPLMVSETAQNLRRVYRLSELMKAQAPKNSSWKPLRVHVIGAGTMGADIAGWCVASGMEVSLQDLSKDQISKGIKAQSKLFARKFRTRATRAAADARLIADRDGDNIAHADVVIEAVVEKLEVKQQIFSSLQGKLKPSAVLATNTSSLMIEDIARALDDPGRLIGLHFFNPVARMPLVEIVRGADSREEELTKGAVFVAAIDKFPLIVKSVPGFLVNRVLGPYLMEAYRRLEVGEDKDKIDQAARAFGMPMGPIELSDTVGLDVCWHVGAVLGFGGGEGSKLDRLVKAGHLGKKTGEGFYTWVDGKPTKQQQAFEPTELRRLGRLLIEPLIIECERCRDEKVVDSADMVDAGVIFGTGFAPFRGGPLHFRANEHDPDAAANRRAAAE